MTEVKSTNPHAYTDYPAWAKEATLAYYRAHPEETDAFTRQFVKMTWSGLEDTVRSAMSATRMAPTHPPLPSG